MKRFLPKSEFGRNVVTLMTGIVIAQVIPIAISPILTRIYTPEHFGVFALYMSVTSIIATIATGRYELAIMLPRKDEDAINLVALSIIIALLISSLSFGAVYIFNVQLTSLLGNAATSEWLYFIAFTGLLTGTYQGLNYWFNRKKQYKQLARIKILQSTITSSTHLGLGLSGFNSSGLIAGQIIGQGFATFALAKIIWHENSKLLTATKKLKIVALMRKYIKFPQYDLPSSIAYTIYTNMAVIFFSNFFSSSVAGYYFLANKIIKLPFSFFTSAFSDVFYQKISNKNNYEEIAKEINNFSLKLLKNTLIPFIVVIYSSFFYAKLIFGNEWKDIYIYIYIFSMPAYIGLLLAPYGHILKVINKQEFSMYLHLSRLIILGLFFISFFYFDYSLLCFLFAYAVLDACMHLLLGFVVDKIINNNVMVAINSYRTIVLFIFIILNSIIIF